MHNSISVLRTLKSVFCHFLEGKVVQGCLMSLESMRFKSQEVQFSKAAADPGSRLFSAGPGLFRLLTD